MTPDECAQIATRGRFKPGRDGYLYNTGAAKSLGLGRGSTRNGIHIITLQAELEQPGTESSMSLDVYLIPLRPETAMATMVR